jgi:hypothetical protein
MSLRNALRGEPLGKATEVIKYFPIMSVLHKPQCAVAHKIRGHFTPTTSDSEHHFRGVSRQKYRVLDSGTCVIHQQWDAISRASVERPRYPHGPPTGRSGGNRGRLTGGPKVAARPNLRPTLDVIATARSAIPNPSEGFAIFTG